MLAALAEFHNGRKIWGIAGQPGFWSGDINSEHNSQYSADPYSFTHLTHGILLYGLAWLAARRLPLQIRMLMVLGFECLWEAIENTDTIIESYRAATISLHYYGDSIANSMSDVLFCMMGFAVAAILPTRFSLAFVVLLELSLGFWIRDNFSLNVIMLIHSFPAIRIWQSGA